MKRRWRKVAEDPRYSVSDDGFIRSHEGHILKSALSTNGAYPTVAWRLPNDDAARHGKMKSFKVHRLVALAFIRNPNNKPCVNHRDSNKTNNHYRNLEWCTNHENILHSVTSGTRASKKHVPRDSFGRFSCG